MRFPLDVVPITGTPLASDQWFVIVCAIALAAFVAGVVIPQLWK